MQGYLLHSVRRCRDASCMVCADAGMHAWCVTRTAFASASCWRLHTTIHACNHTCMQDSRMNIHVSSCVLHSAPCVLRPVPCTLYLVPYALCHLLCALCTLWCMHTPCGLSPCPGTFCEVQTGTIFTRHHMYCAPYVLRTICTAHHMYCAPYVLRTICTRHDTVYYMNEPAAACERTCIQFACYAAGITVSYAWLYAICCMFGTCCVPYFVCCMPYAVCCMPYAVCHMPYVWYMLHAYQLSWYIESRGALHIHTYMRPSPGGALRGVWFTLGATLGGYNIK